MACQAIHSWTFTSLIGAYLDLAITYLLLCASTLAFFTSKFLSFFGLLLPCPCNGLFSSTCLQRFLVDTPVQKISNVQMDVRNKFPFDAILMSDRCFDVKLLQMDDGVEREDTSDSRVERNKELGRFGLVKGKGVEGFKDKDKEKEGLSYRARPGSLRRRRRVPPVDGSRRHKPSFSSARIGQEITEDGDSSVAFTSQEENRQNGEEANTDIHSDEGLQHSFQWNDMLCGSKNFERDESSASDVVRSVQLEMGSEANAIRVLEQALEEERAARDALYQELEKEISAAASAADEAMAMILRLQKEKASTEMEAKQYQRMIEEKSAYDEEEMNILKEIVVRREREKYFLEKEVETYRQMVASGNEDLTGLSLQRPHMSFDSSDDPAMMLQQISEYIDKKELVKKLTKPSDYEKHGRVLAFGDETPSAHRHVIDDILKRGDTRRSLSSDKHYLHGPIDECAQSQLEVDNFIRSQEKDSPEKTILVAEEHGKYDAVCQETAAKNDQTDKTEISFPCDNLYLEKNGNDANQAVMDWEDEPTVLDVHVINDNSKLCNQRSESAIEQPLKDTLTERCRSFDPLSETSGLRNADILSDLSGASRREAQPSFSRSMSDTRSMSGKAHGHRLFSDLRRNSISSVDCERMKLDNEVGSLRERLKIVQEGREKLSFSVEHREREKLDLQFLEDIARQLREIRQLTEPGKSVRQASLPPSSAKVSSKKRRCRSVTLGINGSS